MATLSLTNPTVGGSEDTWGTTLNANFTAISSFIGSLDSTELAVLDGITATTAELNILDGVTATAAELNTLDGFTGVVGDFNIIAGGAAAGVTATEFQYLNGVTSAIQTQLDAKAPLASPALTGTPTAPTAATTTNTTQIATTAFVQQEITANSSGLAFLATADASSDATIDFTAFSAANYDAYIFVFSNVVPATDAVILWMRTSTDGGSSFDSGASDYAAIYNGLDVDNGGATNISFGDNTAAEIRLTPETGSASGEDGVSGTVFVLGPHLAKETRVVSQLFGKESQSDKWWFVSGGGARLSAADVDAVRFLFSSGNIESGTITMYGLRNA